MSSQRSRGGAAATRGRAAARPAARGVYLQKPRSDVYVALLGVALGSLLVGCLFLLIHLSRYNFSIKAAALPPARTAAATV